MTDTLWLSPTHKRKQVQCFKDMGQRNSYQKSCSNEPYERPFCFCFREEDYGPNKQEAYDYQCNECLEQCGRHTYFEFK